MGYFDIDEAAVFIAERTGCTVEQALTYLYVEDDYFDKIGLNVYPDEINQFILSEEKNSGIVVDDAEVIAFVLERTDLARELIEKIIEAEFAYMGQQGLISEPEK